MQRLARLVTRRPRRVVGVGFVVVILAFVLGGPLPGLLQAGGDDFEDPAAQSTAARTAVERATGVAASPGIVALVSTPGGATSSEGQSAIGDAAQRLAAVPGIERVVTPAEGGPTLVSRDGTAAIVPAVLAADADEADVVAAAEDAFAGSGVVLGGSEVAQDQISSQVQSDLLRAELIALPLLLVLSLWIFRSPVAALLPVLVGASTVMGTFLVLRVVDATAMGLSAFALNLVTGLGLGLAVDYSLLLVSRFREEVGRGRTPAEAVGAALMTSGRTIVFSALTVSAAMMALVVFPQRFLQSMGIAGAIVPLVAAAASLTLLAGLLALLGSRVDAFVPRRLVRHEPSDANLHRTGWYRLAQRVLRRPGRVAATTGLLLILLGLPFLGVRFTGVDASVLPADHSARQVDDALRAGFDRDAASPILVAVTAPAADGAEVQAYRDELASVAGEAATVSAPQPLGDTWRIDVEPATPSLDGATKDLVRDVRALDAPFPVAVGGSTADFIDGQDSLRDHVPLALAVLVSTTIVLLFLMTGSIVLPIKAVVMNALTICATFGLLVLLFQDGRLTGLLDYEPQGALESTQPILLFAIIFALSTDYGTFLLGRIGEARAAGVPDREAIAIGLARTGRVVTAAALLMVTAIGAFATSEIVFIKLIGVGAALAVLIDATIVRALLVPALMGLLGRANWYAPRWLQAVHRRVGLHEGAAAEPPAPRLPEPSAAASG